MKPLRLLPLFLLLLVTGSCEVIPDDGWEVDWSPVDVIIEAVDAGGNSIISPDMPGMSLTFKGETYTVKTRQPEYELPTKAYLAIMFATAAKSVARTFATAATPRILITGACGQIGTEFVQRNYYYFQFHV